jgi:hypothetical protein
VLALRHALELYDVHQAKVAGAKATSTPSAPSRPFPAPPFPGHHAPSPAPRRPAGAAGTACPYCGGRLRLIATLHDPAVIRKILAHMGVGPQGRAPAPPHRSPAASRPDRLLEGAADAVVPARRGVISDGPAGPLAGRRRAGRRRRCVGIACRSAGRAWWAREETANALCGIGLLGRPASESGRLCRVDGGHERGDHLRRPFLLTTLRCH